jgi:hypothetical protein
MRGISAPSRHPPLPVVKSTRIKIAAVKSIMDRSINGIVASLTNLLREKPLTCSSNPPIREANDTNVRQRKRIREMPPIIFLSVIQVMYTIRQKVIDELQNLRYPKTALLVWSTLTIKYGRKSKIINSKTSRVAVIQLCLNGHFHLLDISILILV